MAIGTCTITEDRLTAVDFSDWFWISTTIIGSRLSEELKPPFIVFDVFTIQVRNN